MIDGNPACESGPCKYIPDPDSENVPVPINLFKYSGLKDFWKIFQIVTTISPCDVNALPTVSLIQAYEGTINMDPDVFFVCLANSIERYRAKIYNKRKKR